MKSLLTICTAVLLVAAMGCKGSAGKTQAGCVEKPCTNACTKEYKPVCGCNDKTYGNACMAECHGIKKYTPGECPKK
ncbi:hypothetical protein BH09BAC1_BH09BAC1_20140 [soil metagenome]